MSKTGYKQSAEHKAKIGAANAVSHVGLKWNKESKEKMSATLKQQYRKEGRKGAWDGKKFSEEHREKIGSAHRGRKTGFNAVAVTDARIKKEIVELEAQGFRCVPTGGNVRPDIIGIKDGKIYAIEVEYKKPNYGKYTDEAKAYFDDVIWILRGKI